MKSMRERTNLIVAQEGVRRVLRRARLRGPVDARQSMPLPHPGPARHNASSQQDDHHRDRGDRVSDETPEIRPVDQAEVARAVMALVAATLHGGTPRELTAMWTAYAEEAPDQPMWACLLSLGLAQVAAENVIARTGGDRARAIAEWQKATVANGPDSNTEHARKLRGEL